MRLAAAVAAGTEPVIRAALAEAADATPAGWVEEAILQSYLFCGFPRTLNAMREWRRVTGAAAPNDAGEPAREVPDAWRARGEHTCAVVYGASYEPLRRNVRVLHPALDDWMVVDGYGKIIGRPGLDLARRELCIVAACAATQQERQLHAHLRGALNAGAAAAAVTGALAIAAEFVGTDAARAQLLLWQRVQGK